MENKLDTIMKLFFEHHGISEQSIDKITFLRTKLYCLEFTKNHESIENIKNSFGYRISKEHLPKEILSDEYIVKIIKHI